MAHQQTIDTTFNVIHTIPAFKHRPKIVKSSMSRFIVSDVNGYISSNSSSSIDKKVSFYERVYVYRAHAAEDYGMIIFFTIN